MEYIIIFKKRGTEKKYYTKNIKSAIRCAKERNGLIYGTEPLKQLSLEDLEDEAAFLEMGYSTWRVSREISNIFGCKHIERVTEIIAKDENEVRAKIAAKYYETMDTDYLIYQNMGPLAYEDRWLLD